VTRATAAGHDITEGRMHFSNQKLAITGFALAAACVILGRWGLSTAPIRERDVLAVFGGGLLAGFSTVRFFKQWRAAPDAPPPAEVPPPPPAAPRSKS
jgi:hypothetical protein